MEEEKPKRGANLLPYQWKKGQSGNLKGRPKGKTMKDYAREYLSKLTDEERDEWLEGLDKIEVWKMSEGSPHTQTDITSGGLPLILPAQLIDKNDTPPLTGTSGEGQAQV